MPIKSLPVQKTDSKHQSGMEAAKGDKNDDTLTPKAKRIKAKEKGDYFDKKIKDIVDFKEDLKYLRDARIRYANMAKSKDEKAPAVYPEDATKMEEALRRNWDDIARRHEAERNASPRFGALMTKFLSISPDQEKE